MEEDIRTLHQRILAAWNKGDATGFAAQFAPDGICIGFDGSEYTSASEIASQLDAIFKDHQVASYVGVVREVRFLDDNTALLRAGVSMTPPGSNKVMPERNAVQLLLAIMRGGKWRIASLQNTPAKLDGRPEEVEKMTREMQEIADSRDA